MGWQEQRRDNTRLVRRVRDLVTPVDEGHARKAFEDAFASLARAAAGSHVQLEAVGDYGYLEPVDGSLAGTCLVTINVEVVGLNKDHRVWICGGTQALGEWDASKGVELAYSPELSLERGVAHVWSAILRLPSSHDVMYKYCAARADADAAQACWEFGTDRLLRTPAHARAAVFDRLHSPLTVVEAREQTPAPNVQQLPRQGSTSLRPDRACETDSSRLESVYECRKTTPEWVGALGGLADLAYQPLILRVQQHATQGDGLEGEAREVGSTVQFDVEAHGVGHEDEIYVCGSHDALGGWKQERGVRLFRVLGTSSAPCGQWRCQVRLPNEQQVKYKYVVKRGGHWQWEPGLDRSLTTAQQGGASLEDCLGDASCSLCAGVRDRAGAGDQGHERAVTAEAEEPELNGVAVDLLRDVDAYLREERAAGKDATPFETQVRTNRLLLQRCHSVLEKTVDDYTREQVMQRMEELEDEYAAAGTVSHQIHMAQSDWPLVDASSPPLSRVSSPSPVSFAAADDSERVSTRKPWRRAGLCQGRGWSARMRASPTRSQAPGKKHLAHAHSFSQHHDQAGVQKHETEAYMGPVIGVVDTVLADGPASRAGLREGDHIIAMGRTDAKSVLLGGSLFAAVANEVRDKAAEGGSMDVIVLREVPGGTAGGYRKQATLRLQPSAWHGEGLLGMRIVQLPQLPLPA